MNAKNTSIRAAILFTTLAALSATAAIPNVINYQGYVRSGDAAVNGQGQFKFAILRSGTIWWRNAPDGNGDGEPDAAVARSVADGLFSVPLGDTSIANMAAMTFFDPGDPNNASTSTDPVLLRIWFNDGVNGFRQLAPDQPLTTAPFATWAANVAAGAITANQLASGAVTGPKIAANAITSTHIAAGSIATTDLATGVRSVMDAPDGNPAGVVRVDNAGLVQVGTVSSGLNLIHQVDGSATVWSTPSTIGIIVPHDTFGDSRIISGEASGTFVGAFDGASGLAVSGTTAYVVARDDSTFSVVNNTDPTAPIIIGMLTNGVGVTSLDEPEAIAVVGNFAYVVSQGSANSFTVINITSPGLPTIAAVRSDGVGGFTDLLSPSDVAVSANGNTAFVAAESDDAVNIINVTTKSNPTLISVIKEGVGGITTLNAPRQLIVSGTRLYVRSAEAVTIFNISTLTSPTVIATIAGNKSAMALSGTTLFTTTLSALETWNVSGTTPVSLNSVGVEEFSPENSGNANLSISRMFVDGVDLWAVTRGSGLPERVMLLDISTPASPILTHMAAGTTATGTYINEPFISSPRVIAGTGGGNAIVLNATPGAFVNIRATTQTYHPSLLTEGDVGVRVSHPMAALHVNGSTLIEGGNLTVGSGGHSAFGKGSIVVGHDNVNRSVNSAAIGQGLLVGASDTATSPEVTVGQFNVASTGSNPIRFSVGNGVSGARTNALTITSRGRMGLDGVSNPSHSIQHASGAHLTVGGSWVNASDRNLKENIQPASGSEILERIASLPIYTWNYKAESSTNRHLGPMAQDFHAAFNLGGDDKTIATVDASGVALAAIRALLEENKSLRTRLEAVERQVAERNEK